jgi:hypothetical protein
MSHGNRKKKLIGMVASTHHRLFARAVKFGLRLNTLRPELNPSAQRYLARLFTEDFASWTVPFVHICVKNQQMQQLVIQFINYVR